MRRSVSPTDLAQKAFVRGLAEEVTEEDLRRLFSKFGNVVEVIIAKDRDTNAPRGFGFITFENSTDCNKACSDVNGKDFHGRSLLVELASHFNKVRGGRGGFRGSSRGGGSFRGGRGGRTRSASPPPRDGGFRRGASWRGGSGRGDYRGYGGRPSDSMYADEDRFRSEFERDPPPRDYGSRYDEYRGRPERMERDFPDGRGDYASYRSREFSARDRDFVPMRSREYYSPPRDYPPIGRDYPPLRDERDYDMPPRRYAGARDYMDDYPPSGSGAYDSRPPRRDYDLAPRDYGSSGRYESFASSSRGGYKSKLILCSG